MNQAVGLVEIKGLASAVTIADVMVKVAAVTLMGIERARGFGWMTIEVSGDVAAVQAAVDAAKAKAKEHEALISALVIPRPAKNLETVFFKNETKEVVSEKVQEQAVLIESNSEESLKAKDSLAEIEPPKKNVENAAIKKDVSHQETTKKNTTKKKK